MFWFVYIAQCRDGTLYTGITTDPTRREKEHNESNALGAKSLRGKRPIKIVYQEQCLTHLDARKREIDIKGWRRKYKLKLIEENKEFPRKHP